jgi:hypothetical protein
MQLPPTALPLPIPSPTSHSKIFDTFTNSIPRRNPDWPPRRLIKRYSSPHAHPRYTTDQSSQPPLELIRSSPSQVTIDKTNGALEFAHGTSMATHTTHLPDTLSAICSTRQPRPPAVTRDDENQPKPPYPPLGPRRGHSPSDRPCVRFAETADDNHPGTLSSASSRHTPAPDPVRGGTVTTLTVTDDTNAGPLRAARQRLALAPNARRSAQAFPLQATDNTKAGSSDHGLSRHVLAPNAGRSTHAPPSNVTDDANTGPSGFDIAQHTPAPNAGRNAYAAYDLDDDDSVSSCNSAASSRSAPAVLMTAEFCHFDSKTPESVRQYKTWPPDEDTFMAAIKKALAWQPRARTAPIFDFRMTTAAAHHNFAVLQRANFDLQSVLLSNAHSPIRPGSEFRPVGLLEPIFNGHPLWPRMKRSLLLGATMVLEPITDADRHTQLAAALAHGNHPSATRQAATIHAMLEAEVTKGWQLPLPIDRLFDIPGVVVAPLGLVDQHSIDGDGRAIDKNRLTHDQSFDFKLEPIRSVNQRVVKAALSACKYGFTLPRLLHIIIALRTLFPTVALLLTKWDFKSAYRRLHFGAHSALQSVVTTTGLSPVPIALASLRATFGGSPCPNLFSEISESITDLANALVRCSRWDPTSLSPLHANLVGTPIRSDPAVPLAPARMMSVDPKVDAFGSNDVFIDDIVGVFPDLSVSHTNRCTLSPLLALEIAGRPLLSLEGEKLPRDEILALAKAMAEGTPAEAQIILGWLIDTRHLLMSLPANKYTAWTSDITAVLALSTANRHVPHAVLKTLLGRLQHTAAILVEGNHFLNRIRSAELRAKRRGKTRLNAETRNDFIFWKSLLERAHRGIDINLLVSRHPDHMIRTDACEHGLGGYSLTTGRAWRWEIPVKLRNLKSINFLEFLACITGIVISMVDGEGKAGDCYLSLGDNTSSLGWLRKSNFAADTEQSAHSALARVFALLMADWSLCLTSRWFAGKENEVADLCSRNHSRPDEYLTAYIKLVYPTQVSPAFQVSSLPAGLDSWLSYWVRRKHDETASPPPLTSLPIATSPTGSSSCTAANLATTSSLTGTAPTSGTSSSARSPKPCANEPIPTVQRDMITWLRRHARPPSDMYARPSSQRVDPIRHSTRMARLHSFYNASTKGTGTTTPRANRKKRSRSI